LKVALIVPGGVDRSGTERVIPCLLWFLERLSRQAEVHVFAFEQEAEPGTWELLGATVHNTGQRLTRWRTLREILAEHRRGRFDVVHAWWAAGPGSGAALFKKLIGVPVVLTLPGGDFVRLPKIDYGAQLTARGRMRVRFAVRSADRVLVPSEFTRIEAERHGVKSERVPLGVALDRWTLAKPRRRKPGSVFNLIHVANLNPVKDQSTLLRSMRDLADRGLDFELDIIGTDTLDGAIQQLSADLGLGERVHFRGFMPHDATRQFVERADLLVMSSWSETVPMVLSEAAIAGVPTVGTAVGQIADWAPGAAVAVPSGDWRALADAIIELSSNEERRMNLARQAQARALAEDADHTAERTLEIYRELASQR
jgi:glycosyltransferase involved in cell wall biosynthesis